MDQLEGSGLRPLAVLARRQGWVAAAVTAQLPHEGGDLSRAGGGVVPSAMLLGKRCESAGWLILPWGSFSQEHSAHSKRIHFQSTETLPASPFRGRKSLILWLAQYRFTREAFGSTRLYSLP